MRLDERMPRWDKRERHELAFDAPPAAVREAIEELTWREVPVFRGLMLVRTLGGLALADDGRVLDLFPTLGFEVWERDHTEIVLGYDVPSKLRIAFNFRYQEGVLSTETRVRSADRTTRSLFALYWLVIRAWSGLIRITWLRSIRARAELTVRRNPPNATPA